MIVSCPTCEENVDVADSDAGVAVSCPECGHAFIVPQIASQAQEVDGESQRSTRESLAKGIASAAWQRTPVEKKRKAKLWGCGCLTAVLVPVCGIAAIGVLMVSGAWSSIKENFGDDDGQPEIVNEVRHDTELDEDTDSGGQAPVTSATPSKVDGGAEDVLPKPSVISPHDGLSVDRQEPTPEAGESLSQIPTDVVEDDHAERVAKAEAVVQALDHPIHEQIEALRTASQEPDQSDPHEDGATTSQTDSGNNIAIGFLVCCAFLLALMIRLRGKCPNCKLRRVFNLVGKQELNREHFFRTVRERQKRYRTDGYGGRNAYYEDELVDRPFTRITYLNHYRCKSCGHEKEEVSTVEKRERSAGAR